MNRVMYLLFIIIKYYNERYHRSHCNNAYYSVPDLQNKRWVVINLSRYITLIHIIIIYYLFYSHFEEKKTSPYSNRPL